MLRRITEIMNSCLEVVATYFMTFRFACKFIRISLQVANFIKEAMFCNIIMKIPCNINFSEISLHIALAARTSHKPSGTLIFLTNGLNVKCYCTVLTETYSKWTEEGHKKSHQGQPLSLANSAIKWLM